MNRIKNSIKIVARQLFLRNPICARKKIVCCKIEVAKSSATDHPSKKVFKASFRQPAFPVSGAAESFDARHDFGPQQTFSRTEDNGFVIEPWLNGREILGVPTTSHKPGLRQ